MKKLKIVFAAVISIVMLYSISGCQKQKYNTISQAAYLRVFNDLNYTLTVDNKDAPLPFLTMLIDPVTDSKGNFTSASIVGDHLDVRANYAPPYPAHAGNTGFKNQEYPGQEHVLVGPILNGYDLSSWAQVPSGKHRVVFVSRPITADDFFTLDPTTRNNVVVDTTINLTAGEVYTMETLNADAYGNKVSLYLRDEQFPKMPFSDSSVYVNFYNLSSKGYWQKNFGVINAGAGTLVPAIKDTMNIYLSLLKPSSAGNPYPSSDTALVGFNSVYFGQVIRSIDNSIHPYYNFPLFPQRNSNDIDNSAMYEFFEFYAPGYDNNRLGTIYPPLSYPNYESLMCSGTNYTNGLTPNLIISTASGDYNPRSFGTINTIELINGHTYLMTIQRKYDPPVIH